MSKIIQKYRGYSATDIKTAADIPSTGSMVVSGDNLLCSDILISAVKNILSESSYNLSDLCTSTGVNLWAAFCPVIRTVTGASVWEYQLVNSAPTEMFSLGDFAGYNHNAVTPGWGTGGKAAAQADIWIVSNSKATFISDVVIGELQYPSESGIVLCAFDSSNVIKAWSRITTNDLKDTANLTCDSTDNLTVQETFTLKSYIVNSNTITTANDIDDAIICRIPNVDNATVTVKIKAASSWYYDQSGNQTIPLPWVQNGSAGMNWTSGYFNIGSIESGTSVTVLRVYVSLFDWTDTLIGTADLFNGNYTAYYDITGSVYLGLAPIANYGYRVVVYFEVQQ